MDQVPGVEAAAHQAQVDAQGAEREDQRAQRGPRPAQAAAGQTVQRPESEEKGQQPRAGVEQVETDDEEKVQSPVPALVRLGINLALGQRV